MQIEIRPDGEANKYTLIDKKQNKWIAAIQFNGEMPLDRQQTLLRIMANSIKIQARLARSRQERIAK